MFDLHNHLLPGIDDGSPDIETSIELAKIAVDEGITHLVSTPHIHPRRYENNRETIGAALSKFRDALEKANIELQVSAAAEVRFDIEIIQKINEDSIPFLGEWQGQKLMLLEFPHGEMPVGCERLISWLFDRGIRCIIAHPERNRAVMRDPQLLAPLLDYGCLLQVTADSVCGGFGPRAEEVAKELLEAGVVTILATDAHNIKNRPPSMLAGLEAAAKILGSDSKAEMLVLQNPKMISESHFA